MSDTVNGGKAAIVTGAASGNGRAIARKLANEGAKVMIMDIQPEPRLDGPPTHKAIQEEGGTAQFIEGDVTSQADFQKTIDKTVDKFGSLDIMVNNAGIFPGSHPIEEVNEDEYDKQMDINLKGVFFGSKLAIEQMKKQSNGGAVVNMSSIDGIRGLSKGSVYSATKGGVGSLTRSLAYEVGPDGIRVNAVAPGFTETAMLGNTDIDEISNDVPLRRVGQPDDIANAVAFLASNEAAYINGHTLVVDGGLTIRSS